MNSRRKFLESSLAGLAGITLLPTVNSFAMNAEGYRRQSLAKPKLRFAIASDIHFGQQGTDFEPHTANLVKWLNDDHAKNHIDLVIINGDLVHDKPKLLTQVKNDYLDKLNMPYYTIPGNHDRADAKIWKDVFGYEDKYYFEKADIAFVLANTANTSGGFVCPDAVFIRSSLDKLTDKNIIFMILHIPPIQWIEYEINNFLNCPDIVTLLHAYPNIKAVFHGHDHLLDGVRYTNKLPHFFDSHIGGDWGTNYRGYRIVEVNDDNSIYTYQINGSQSPLLNNNRL